MCLRTSPAAFAGKPLTCISTGTFTEVSVTCDCARLTSCSFANGQRVITTGENSEKVASPVVALDSHCCRIALHDIWFPPNVT